jgi:hypothetical protein
MPTVNLSPVGGAAAQFFDNAGNVLTGGKVETYAAGTNTPQVTYTSFNGLTAHSNPIILDASGRVPGGEIWLIAGANYKFVLKDSNNVLIGTYDNISTFASDATLITYTPASANAVETTVARKLYQTVSVFDFMTLAEQNDVTAGTLLLDVTTSIQNAINSIGRGILIFPPGQYKTTATINIFGKNAQNDATQSSLEILAYGAKIVSSVTGSIPAVYISGCKRLIISGLEVSTTSTLNVQVQGLWNSTWDSCNFGNVEFLGLGASFDSHYWSRFVNCAFGTITIRTGTNANRSEFNAITFDTCRIWGGEYGIRKFGSHSIRDVVFINCDISYQTLGILYVDEATAGDLSFYGAFFDSANGFPIDTKGISLDFNGSIVNPNSANTSSFFVNTASRSQSKGSTGVRVGSRIPTSGYNLINNGDLRAGNAGFSTFNAATTITPGTGLFGQYANFVTSVAFGRFTFSSIAVPVEGAYTLTVIGRTNSGGATTSCNGIFGAISLGSDWTISSFTTQIAQGASVSLQFNASTGAAFNIDIAYVGLTYGSSAPIYVPIHPSADFYSPGTVQGGFTNVTVDNITLNNAIVQDGIRTEVFTKTYTPSLSATNILAISSSGHTTFEVDVFYIDITSPNCTFLQKLYIATIGSGNNVTNISIVQEDKVKNLSSGSATDYLTWTASVVSNQVMLIATASATTGGDGTINMQVTGNINGGTVQ